MRADLYRRFLYFFQKLSLKLGVSTYPRIYTVFVSLLLNAENVSKKCFITKNKIVNKNVIKSSCSLNKFYTANLKCFVYTNYLKICFNITILLYMLFLSIKYMHSINAYMFLKDVFWKKCELIHKPTPSFQP